ncbi:MAG: DNA-binding protein WhiA [Lachnospiraceae bacterium]|nr:DNA-binding protein WhiA [Lachnospiraceae bacterium]MDD7379501.1 DNA-binding protein WhiA [Lachnospiraceae bacterium]MDY4616363.1 DNA-binding protein WhiA [Lachnospiraceae bacterium]
MSFSGSVKEELLGHISKSRHCQLAELAAFLNFSGRVIHGKERDFLSFESENEELVRKYFTLAKKTYNIKASISDVEEREITGNLFHEDLSVKNSYLQNACCKRAFIRGAFLTSGSMSDPEKAYHFEIVCNREDRAEQLRDIMNSFGMEAKIVSRKRSYVVYLKEGEQIVDILNIMEAPVALMNLENIRILKEMRNSVNRQVNCETANIHKTVSAAVKQIEDIEYLREKVGLEHLPLPLREMAYVRLEHPDAPLKELGTYLVPAVGKSGVNHRLRKLGIMAEDLRVSEK